MTASDIEVHLSIFNIKAFDEMLKPVCTMALMKSQTDMTIPMNVMRTSAMPAGDLGVPAFSKARVRRMIKTDVIAKKREGNAKSPKNAIASETLLASVIVRLAAGGPLSTKSSERKMV